MDGIMWRQTRLALVLLLVRITYISAFNLTSTPLSDGVSVSTTLPATTQSDNSLTNMITEVQCRSGQRTQSGQCCEECAEGFGVHQQCTANNATNTICAMCVPGVTFSDVTSHVAPCHPCRQCGHNEILRTECDITRDTVCECTSNYYRSEAVIGSGSGRVISTCTQCITCPPGFGATVPCSSDHNSKCNLCENGTYSDSISETEKCKPCSMCREGSSVLKPCTRFSDTLCSDNAVPTLAYKPVSEHVTTRSHVHGTEVRSSGFSVVPIFCTLLGLLIFGLLAYVIFKKWSFKKMKLRQTNKMQRSSSCHTDLETNAISILSLKNGQSFQSRDSAMNMSGTGSICRQPLLAVPSSTPYQLMPTDKRSEVERALSSSRMDGRDWRGLARELGFSDVDIVRIAQSSTGATPPARSMLVAWQSKDSKLATVGTLVEALRRIRRNDVADLMPIFTYSAYHFPMS